MLDSDGTGRQNHSLQSFILAPIPTTSHTRTLVAIVPRQRLFQDNMTDIIIIGLVGLFLAIIFATVYFLPTALIKWRASTLGLSLTYGQARVIAKDHCNTKDFLIGVKDIWFWVDIPIGELTRHYSAKGDMMNLRDGIILMKQKNRDIEIRVLSTFDIAGRDLKEEIRKAEKRNWIFDLTAD